MEALSSLEWRQQYRLLGDRARLRNLAEELRAAAMSRPDYEPHDVTDDEAAIQADAIEGRLAAIDQALERIDLGEYGVCRVCGSAIADQRLEALSATTVCRGCAG